MFEIEDGVPMIKEINKRPKFPFAEMKVGQSIVIDKKQYNSAYMAAHYVQAKISGKSIDDKKMRVWRVA